MTANNSEKKMRFQFRWFCRWLARQWPCIRPPPLWRGSQTSKTRQGTSRNNSSSRELDKWGILIVVASRDWPESREEPRYNQEKSTPTKKDLNTAHKQDNREEYIFPGYGTTISQDSRHFILGHTMVINQLLVLIRYRWM